MSSTTIPASVLSTLTEEEQKKYQERLADKSKPYYYGYDIEKDANVIVYPVSNVDEGKSITLDIARGRGLQLYPKRNIQIMNKIRGMVVGMGGCGPIDSIPGGIKQLTEANSDEFTINYILEDLEKEKKVVKVYDYKLVGPAWNTPDWEKPHREYDPIKFKWYTIEKAEVDGVLEIKCRYCSKKFPSEHDMKKHFNNSHTPRRRV